jgi:hypothetical protein
MKYLQVNYEKHKLFPMQKIDRACGYDAMLIDTRGKFNYSVINHLFCSNMFIETDNTHSLYHDIDFWNVFTMYYSHIPNNSTGHNKSIGRKI